MQNNTATRVQRMMSKQTAYAPVGMVSQDMSGNKKTGTGLLGINLNTTNVTPGLTFSNKNTTVTNSSAAGYTSAVGNAATNIGDTSVYWEFIMTNSGNQWFGFAISSFNCNHADLANVVVGQVANTWAVHSTPNQFAMAGASQSAFGTYIIGDIIGLHLQMTSTTMNISVYKNGVFQGTRDHSAYLTLGNTISYVPAWSSAESGASATISNAACAAPTGAKRLTTPNTSALVVVSASVPAVADGAYDVYTFNSSGTFTTVTPGIVRALVVAGGGAGGSANINTGSGGGGAGGYYERGIFTTPQTYAITVGGGGTAPVSSAAGSVGTNSIALGLTTIGGGGGGSTNSSGAEILAITGGSGGGGAGFFNDIGSAGAVGTSGQGFSGGTGASSTTDPNIQLGGGGGGSSSIGSDGTSIPNGGSGTTSFISGTSITYAGGGGGGKRTAGTAGTGGSGGGGSGAADANGSSGVTNTGGGGGGCGTGTGVFRSGGNGGSGVVIIRVRARA